MDLLDKINSLAGDQLRLIAERDDASGVLAAYRLSELRGLPYPDRSAVVLAEDYAIVAQDGKISRIGIEGVVKIIRQEGDQYCVYSEDGTRSFGCYDTRLEAERRLQQIHYFDQEKQDCPPATQDVRVNLLNRADAIEVADYGPLDPSEPNEPYWENLAGLWEIPIEEVKSARCGNCAAFDITSKMSDCIAEGLDPDTEDPYDVVDAGELGYCRMFKFKCASARTCSAWISGGPITDDTVQETKSVGKERRFVRKAEEKRFTLGPLYVPDFMDAHGEWTDAEELQSGVWHWVRSGDRRIFLQHDPEAQAGEWVEVMTMPQSWTVNMHDAEGSPVGEVTYPPNTVFLGVVWNEEAWEMVKNGELRGYSIGGYSDRMYADLPTDGEREGIELDKASRPQADPGLDIAGSIADAVAAALAKAQPTVNVVLPETRQVARRIERDEHGNIARIIEEEM